MNEIAGDINKLKRQLMFDVRWLTGVAEIVWQAKSCREMFETGCLLPILGKIKISPAVHNTAGRPNGSFRETRSQHGKRPIRVLFCGFMENVCFYPVFPLF